MNNSKEIFNSIIQETMGKLKDITYNFSQLQKDEIPNIVLSEYLKNELMISQGKIREVYKELKKISEKNY